MDLYDWTAVFALAALLAFPTKGGWARNTSGSLILAAAWPAIVTMLLYYSVKKYVLRMGGVSDRHFGLEMLLFVASAVPVILYFKAPELLHR